MQKSESNYLSEAILTLPSHKKKINLFIPLYHLNTKYNTSSFTDFRTHKSK